MLAYKIPITFSTVQAGFPSPADDYVERRLDIHQHLVKRPASTIFFPAPDDAMHEFGIYQNDIVIVDRSLKPGNNKIVLVEIDGERIVRCFFIKKGRGFLAVGKTNTSFVSVDPDNGAVIIGVATCVIHNL